MRGYRRTAKGLVRITPSKARVDDDSTKVRRYFKDYDEAVAFAQRKCDEAYAKGEQSVDRFYMWSGGVCNTFEPRKVV